MCVLGKESWTGRDQINVDNILNSLASYAIPGILCKTSDLEDKQLFQLSFNTKVFLAIMAAKTRWKWDLAASQGARTGGKGKKTQIHSYLQPCKLYASLFLLQGIDSGLLNFGAWQHCVFSLYPAECSTAVRACVCWVSDSLYRGVIVCHSRTFVRTGENFRVDPLPVEDVHQKSKQKQCWQCVSLDPKLFLPWVLKKLTKLWEEFKPYQNGKIGFFPWKWPLGWMRDYAKKVKIRIIYSDFLEIAVPTTLKCSCRILLKFSFKTTLKSWKLPQRTWIFPFLF